MITMIAIRFLHILGVATWIGGLIYMLAILSPSLGLLDGQNRVKLMVAAGKRFSKLATLAVIVLFITGFWRLSYMPVDHAALFSTRYGTILAVKIGLVILMTGIGLYMSMRLTPAIEKAASPEEAAGIAAKAKRLAIINLHIGLLILVLAVSL